MRLILFDRLNEKRKRFHPLALSRPVFNLLSGMASLGEKLAAKIGAADAACFVPPYMAEAYKAQFRWPVNDPATLGGDDLLLVDGRVKAAEWSMASVGPSGLALDDDGEIVAARIAKADLPKLKTESLDALFESAKKIISRREPMLAAWDSAWELVLSNAAELSADFAAANRHGVEGTVEQPFALRGDRRDVYIAPGVTIHPMVVVDVEHGPVYLDEGVEVHPFTRIEGPCYVGKRTILLGCKCREGNSFGPTCRIGGEVEQSIVHGFSNKYHDGFLGHAYVGRWVNLGALTTNSDLRNDYGNVSIVLEGQTSVDTGSTKVGALVGDHAKTSIGTLLNTGAYVGAMTILAAAGRLAPKFIPSFGGYLNGEVTEGFERAKLYATARIAMSRRGRQWTSADETLWNAVYAQTADDREAAFRRKSI